MAKTLDEHFRDWEADTFGFGYGTGEAAILPALRQFLMLCPDAAGYDYRGMEGALTAPAAWLLINALCRVGVLDYGSSPRAAWLSSAGKALKAYVAARTDDALYETVAVFDDGYVHCYRAACNCGPNGYEVGRVCNNPFWSRP